MYYVPPRLNILCGIPSLTGILYCYNKSHEEYEKGRYRWKYWHFGFHSIVTCQLFLTLTYMGKNYSKLNNQVMYLVNPFKNPHSRYLSFNVD